MIMQDNIVYYHLPGLFEFYELYQRFLPLYNNHPEYFYKWCKIGSIYGAPYGCVWGGGRIGSGDNSPYEVLNLMRKYGISSRLTFSNSLLTEVHLDDYRCNKLCDIFNEYDDIKNGIIVYSDLLLNYLKDKYKNLYFVSSTTKVIMDFDKLIEEIDREEFKYVVPDFRCNKMLDKLSKLTQEQKDKVEFLCNECCFYGCKTRKECYERVSKNNLDPSSEPFKCSAPVINDGYRFSKAMQNPGFISVDDILNTYLPLGFSNFKIEGRGLGSAIVLEFLLYYMVKPEYQLNVREEIYLDNMLDLF